MRIMIADNNLNTNIQRSKMKVLLDFEEVIENWDHLDIQTFVVINKFPYIWE